MPMTWNSEADAKLLALIMKVCEIKVPAAKLTEIAALMGADCTPKALTHRIAKFRTAATALAGDGEGSAAASPGPKGTASPKPARSRSEKQGKGKRASSEDDEDENDEGQKGGRKKVKTEATEEEE